MVVLSGIIYNRELKNYMLLIAFINSSAVQITVCRPIFDKLLLFLQLGLHGGLYIRLKIEKYYFFN